MTARLLGVAALTALGFAPDQAAAYRPFESTDADVVDKGELEIEFGALTIERDDGRTGYTVPSLVLNYGLTNALELVGEFELEKLSDGAWEIADPGLFLKAMLRQGALQGRSGLSIATEFGALLPSSKNDKNDIGGETIVIASGKLATFGYHLNLGGGVDRAGNAFWTWGLIGEVPLSNELTLVGEVAGEDATETPSDHFVLLGARFSAKGSDIVFDIGGRRGLTSAAPDWSVTVGLTVSF